MISSKFLCKVSKTKVRKYHQNNDKVQTKGDKIIFCIKKMLIFCNIVIFPFYYEKISVIILFFTSVPLKIGTN